MIEVKNANGEIIFRLADVDARGFEAAVLSGIDLSGGVLEGVNFSDADLSGACLDHCDLYWGIFFRANLQRASLRFASARGSDFKEANLADANLTGADFSPDNLGASSHFGGADLSAAHVEGTLFRRAIYNNTTIFPAAFNPDDHEMIFDEK